MMSTGCRMEVLNHSFEQLKLLLHCTLTTRNLNKNFKKKRKSRVGYEVADVIPTFFFVAFLLISNIFARLTMVGLGGGLFVCLLFVF